jgi:NADP-dependent 3-hydroxy acid dehydrogenase YdfG/MFS family permease
MALGQVAMSIRTIRANVWYLFFSYFFSVLPYTLLPPLTAILLAERGFSTALVGVYSATNFVALMGSSLLVSKLTKRFGERPTYFGATVLSVLAINGYLYSDAVPLWFLFSILTGFTWAVRWIIDESWMARLAPPEKRGEFIGLFEMMIGASSFVGPAILLVTGTETDLPFIVAALCAAVGFLFLLPLRLPQVKPVQEPLPKRFGLLRTIPILLLAALVGGLFETGTTTILPVFAVSAGLGALVATIIAITIGAGSFILQYLFGYLADKLPVQRVLLLGVSITLLATLGLPFAKDAVLLATLAFIFGGVGGGLYTLALIQIGQQFAGARLIQATSLLVFFYSVGSALGPGLGGAALQLSAEYGLVALFGPIALFTLVAMVLLKPKAPVLLKPNVPAKAVSAPLQHVSVWATPTRTPSVLHTSSLEQAGFLEQLEPRIAFNRASASSDRDPKQSLLGKVVMVTGADSELGLATARCLSKHGATLVLAAQDTTKLCVLSKQLPGESLTVKTDTSSTKSVMRLVEKTLDQFGHVDTLLMHLGSPAAPLGGKSRDLKVHIHEQLFCLETVLPHMVKQQSGDIIVSSEFVAKHLTLLHSTPHQLLQGVVNSLRCQVAKHGVRVGVLTSGRICNDAQKLKQPRQLRQASLPATDVAELMLLLLLQPRHMMIHDVVVMPQQP